MQMMLSAACLKPVSSQDRQFVLRCRKGLTICFVAYLVLGAVLPNHSQGALGVALAALSGTLFFALMMLTAALLSRLRDEFQRVLLLRSFLWATTITFGLTCVWGSIEAFSRNALPRVPMLILPVLLTFITAAAKLLIFRKNRAEAVDE